VTTQRQATLPPSPHWHVWHIDLEKPSRSTCACGKVRQHKPIPWSDSEATPKEKRRAKAGRKAKQPPRVPRELPQGRGAAEREPAQGGGVRGKGKREWKWGPRG